MSVVETSYLSGSRIVVTGSMLNHISCISKTGTNIPDVPLSVGVPLIKCLADGGLYKENRLYLSRADLSGWDGVFPMHTHDPDDAFNEGGSLYDIRKLNSFHLLDFNDQSMNLKNWYVESTEAETVALVTERLNGSLYIKGTSNQVAGANKNWNIMRAGLRLDFSYPFIFTCKMVLSHNTALVVRAGMNLPTVQSVAGTQSQVGIEGCTSSSANFQVVSGNGAGSRTGVSLPSASLSYGSPKGYKLEYLPGDRVIFTDALGNEISKTDALPAMNSGTDGDATLRYGLVTSDNISKVLKLFSSHLIGKIFDSRVAIAGWL